MLVRFNSFTPIAGVRMQFSSMKRQSKARASGPSTFWRRVTPSPRESIESGQQPLARAYVAATSSDSAPIVLPSGALPLSKSEGSAPCGWAAK